MKVALLITDNREHHRRYDQPAPYFGAAPEALLEGFWYHPEAEVHVVSCTQRPMQSPEKLAENIWFHSVNVPKWGWLKTGYQGCIRATRRKLDELRPQIVHGQGTERDCAMCAIFSGRPNVVTIHGNMVRVAEALQARVGSFHWAAALLERFALPRTDGVLCNSSYTESVVKPRARRVWRVPNALREEFFETPIAALHAPEKILNIGVISPYKGQNEILSLAEQLHRTGQRFELIFIGASDGGTAYEAEFLQRVKDGEKAGYARYLGTKSMPELLTCLDSASALIHTPTEESFGLVVAEALARNLKLFASRVGGVVDIASGVESAELFAHGDWSGMAGAIQAWLAVGSPRPSSADTEMRARYHPATVARQHLEIYREVLKTRS